jgi:uncharacterized membrane protein YhaH (DUF805 family)
MGFGSAVKHALRHYADFQGRACRSEFWWFNLLWVGGCLSIQALISAVESGPPTAPLSGIEAAAVGIYFMFFFAFAVPELAVTVRRLHDTNRSGWWILLGTVPVVGWVLLVVWLCTKSDSEENIYGISPGAGKLAHLGEKENLGGLDRTTSADRSFRHQLLRFFRGEYSVSTSLWGFFFVGLFMIGFLTSPIVGPLIIMNEGTAAFIVSESIIFSYYTFAAIGVWRSVKNDMNLVNTRGYGRAGGQYRSIWAIIIVLAVGALLVTRSGHSFRIMNHLESP